MLSYSLLSKLTFWYIPHKVCLLCFVFIISAVFFQDVNSVPSILIGNWMGKAQYHGPKNLSSFVQFYKRTTGGAFG